MTQRLRPLAEQIVHQLGNDPVSNVESFLVGFEADVEDRVFAAVREALRAKGAEAHCWLSSTEGKIAVRVALEAGHARP